MTFGHSYDATNRRIGQTVSDTTWLAYPTGGGITNYSVNALSQYTAIGSVTPTYDGNGNLTFDGTVHYGYDAESRLISASATGVTATYAFDGRGHRKSKTVNGVTTLYVGDGTGADVLEYSGATGLPTAWNVPGPGANSLLSRTNLAAGTRTTPIPDIQGSIIATLDSGTGVLTKQGYLPFGGPSPGGFAFGYTGQRFDAETGLYHYHARAYSPTLGRLLQTDPIGYAGGVNLYAYVLNDPLNKVDPYGYSPDSPLAVAAGGTGGGGGAQAPPVAADEEPEDFGGGPGLSSAAQLAANQSAGLTFESAVIDALGAVKNTISVTVPGLGSSVPDLMSGNDITEIKNVINLSNTPQLRIQAGAADTFSLIVSPRTVNISSPLQDAVDASQGTIQVFDPITGVFIPWSGR